MGGCGFVKPKGPLKLGGRMNILNLKKTEFLCPTGFKLLSRIQGNSANICVVSEFRNFS